SSSLSIDILHQRLGHLSWSALKHLGQELDHFSKRKLSTCEGCLLGKSTRRSYTSSLTRSTEPFQLIHMDLCGPMQTRSIEGHDYFMILVDDYTRFLWVKFILRKDEAFENYRNFANVVSTSFERKIKSIRSDRGGEFLSEVFNQFLLNQGTTHQLTAPYTPQQNGMAERANRTVVQAAKAMLHSAGLSYGFWERAIETAVFARNRSPTQSLSFKSPYELLFGRPPDLSYMRIFGCLAYRNIPSDNRRKLDPSAEKLIFVGYDTQTKGYRLWDSNKRRFIVTSDVVFEETIFPNRIQTVPSLSDDYIDLPFPDSDEEDLSPPPHSHAPPQLPPAPDLNDRPVSPIPRELSVPPNPPVQPVPAPLVQPPIRASTRITRGQRWMDPNNVSQDAQRAHQAIQPRGGDNRPPWIGSINSYLQASDTDINGDPTSYKAAMRTPEAGLWMEAMKEEIKSQQENGTWYLTDLPEGRKTIKCRWVFLTKRDLQGNPIRYKARLVAKGFTQQAGIDFEETFAPVARLDSLRFLLALAAALDWEIHQIDIKTAFLNGELEEEIYMEQPEGFVVEGQEDKAGRLVKSIYGLRQASRRWHQHLRQTLLEDNYQELVASDVSIFFKRVNGEIIIVLVYVDDMAAFASVLRLILDFKNLIASKYKYTDIGEIKQFLGLSIVRDRKNKTISIDQRHYIQKILGRFGMTECKPTYSPMLTGHYLLAAEEEQDTELRTKYQSFVGSLMYAMLGSRPDICFAITKLAQFGSNPTKEHLSAAQRVMRYLGTTADLKLIYGKENSTNLCGYSDSDWASDPNNRVSITGYVYILNGGAIAWASRKQRTVALSSTEAEYMALTETVKHAKWMLNLANQLGFEVDLPLCLFSDSKGAKDISNNPVFHKRTKHIDIQHHFIRQQVEEGNVSVERVASLENVADVLTKALAQKQHMKMVEGLGLDGFSCGPDKWDDDN
ncbi:MAG TPA: reverse transcriptase domain-containing protein, partial [Chlamydiales bacterium]|nr:reverse transcriptase domain-containing protein [Chlamydiales bacterium]